MAWKTRGVVRALLGLLTAALGVTAAAAFPVGGGVVVAHSPKVVRGADWSDVSARPPSGPVDLLFLHHSVGAQMLADPGPADARGLTHPNGGGLRRLLEADGYAVHEATYGSALGERTDLFDWLPKFRDEMDRVLRVEQQDRPLPEGRVNRVVLFKSCYPNNYFRGFGTEPGNPTGPELTVENGKAALKALLPLFRARPQTLFVYLTIPPVAGHARREFALKWLAKKVIGHPSAKEKLAEQARLARAFNDWTVSPDGWLSGYLEKNVAVFDLYGVLTDEGASDFSRYPTGGGTDSHSDSAGNRKIAERLTPFVNRALRRAGLADE
jgi:hypothetical protein